MNLCGSNLIPICITIICCAGLFMYFNLRLNDLKIAVEKQNRVLTSFITNVQQDIKLGGCSLAAPEALVAAKNFASGAGAGASGAGAGAGAAAYENTNDKIVVSDDEDESDDSDSSDDDSDSECGENEVDDTNIEPIPIIFEVLPVLSTTDESSITEITEITDEPLTLAAYEQMKVDDLRKIVADKMLATKEEVKKLKKPELLLLLKK